MSLDFNLDSDTGKRLQSPDYAVAATDTPSGKLMSTGTVRIRYLKVTGQKGVPVAAPSDSIKFGLKPGTVALGNYSDTTFDVFTDEFTAPDDPTAADAWYTAPLTIDGEALRALFPVDANGRSVGTVGLIGEILSGGLPSETFAFIAQNNLIKGPESPAVAVPGPSGYPTADTLNSLLSVHGVTNAQRLSLPAGTPVGYTVRVTDQGNRPVEYLGPSSRVVGYYVHGSGGGALDGFYTPRGVNDGVSYFVLQGAPDNGSYLLIRDANWLLYNGEQVAAYSNESSAPTPPASGWLDENGDAVTLAVSVVTRGALDAGCTVSGAGTSAANGVFLHDPADPLFLPLDPNGPGGVLGNGVDGDGHPNWQILDGFGNPAYVAPRTTLFPWDVTVWTPTGAGTLPAPTVTRSDVATNANWLVLRNTVYLTISNGTGQDVSINGIVCAANSNTPLGWVDPANLVVDGEIDSPIRVSSVTYGGGSFAFALPVGGTFAYYGAGPVAAPVPLPIGQNDVVMTLTA